MLVRYRAAEAHLTKTVRGQDLLEGSIHHPELAEFTGIVTQEHEDGTADLVIFPPGRPPAHVAGAQSGDGPGTFSRVG